MLLIEWYQVELRIITITSWQIFFFFFFFMENYLANYFAFGEFIRDNEEVWFHLLNSDRIHYQEEKGVWWLLYKEF